jgi:hypothetical protein
MSVSNCSIVGKNTGDVKCDFVRGNPQVLIFGGKVFSAAETVDEDAYEAAMLEAIKQSTGNAEKMFPLPVIQGVADQTEAAKYGTLGYGLKVKLQRSKQGYEFDVLAGSAVEKRLMAFDGKVIPVIVKDDNVGYNNWGAQDSDGNFFGADYLVGIEPRGFGDGNNPKTTKVTISIVNSQDFVENAAVAPSSFSAGDLVGLNDVKLVEPIAHASNVHYIKLYVPTAQIGNGLDVTEQYSAIASTSLWSAFTGASFSTPLTITSVTYDATNKRLVFTFDSTAYTALGSNAKIKLVPDEVPDLDAADVTGIEPEFIILTKTP